MKLRSYRAEFRVPARPDEVVRAEVRNVQGAVAAMTQLARNHGGRVYYLRLDEIKEATDAD